MAERGEAAAVAFFDRYNCFKEPTRRASYIEWAVPQPKEERDKDGRVVAVAPDLLPYMWKDIDESDIENPVGRSLFSVANTHCYRGVLACSIMRESWIRLPSIWRLFCSFQRMVEEDILLELHLVYLSLQ